MIKNLLITGLLTITTPTALELGYTVAEVDKENITTKVNISEKDTKYHGFNIHNHKGKLKLGRNRIYQGDNKFMPELEVKTVDEESKTRFGFRNTSLEKKIGCDGGFVEFLARKDNFHIGGLCVNSYNNNWGSEIVISYDNTKGDENIYASIEVTKKLSEKVFGFINRDTSKDINVGIGMKF